MVNNIPDEVAQRLEQLAKEQDMTVGEMLIAFLDSFTAEQPAGTLADLAHYAQLAAISSPHPVDTAERSREILNTKDADYLRRRMNDASDDNRG